MDIKRLLIVGALVALMPSISYADIWQDPETKINYEYTPGNSEASVKSGSYSFSGSPEAEGDVFIRSSFVIDGVNYSVTKVGSDAFRQSKITSITIPETIVEVLGNAFIWCNNLTSVQISNLSAWCSITFNSKDSNPLYYAKHLFLNGEEVEKLVIPQDVEDIKSFTFAGCEGLVSVTIPESVRMIRKDAFLNCPNIVEVKTPSIEAWLHIEFFSQASNPISVGSFGQTRLYANDIFVEEVSVSEDLGGIKSYAFANYKYLTSIVFTPPIIYYNPTFSIGAGAFRQCELLENIVFPSRLTGIGQRAFELCDNLKSITFQEDNSSWPVSLDIGKEAFSRCTLLDSINFPQGLRTIGDNAFELCSNLTYAVFPESLNTIGKYTFAQCGLSTISLPQSLWKIGNNAFSNCSDLKKITCHWDKPPFIMRYTFSDETYSTATLIVPSGSEETYKATNYWNLFWNIDSTDNIEFLKAEDSKSTKAIYSLDGKRYPTTNTHSLRKGIYILDGKKIALE